jgi:hypothetical protein
MSTLFEIVWIIAAILMVLFIRRSHFRSSAFIRYGFRLILLSFFCGLGILTLALFLL